MVWCSKCKVRRRPTPKSRNNNATRRLLSFLSGVKGTLTELTFPSLPSLLYGSKFLSSYVPSSFSGDVIMEKGGVWRAWKNFLKGVNGYIDGVKRERDEHMEKVNMIKKTKSDAVELEISNLSEIERRRRKVREEKERLERKLEKIGVFGIQRDEVEVDESYDEIRMKLKTAQHESRGKVLGMLRYMKECVVGVNGMKIISGRNVVDFEIGGFDIGDVFDDVDF